MGDILQDRGLFSSRLSLLWKVKEDGETVRDQRVKGDMTTKSDVVPWTGFWNRERTLMKKVGEIQIKPRF